MHRIHVDFVDPGAEPTTVAATFQTCTAGVHQTGLTNKAAHVSDSRCCHISAVVNLRINIAAASAVELPADFLQPADRVVYQREGSTDWLQAAELHLGFHKPPRETSEGRNDHAGAGTASSEEGG